MNDTAPNQPARFGYLENAMSLVRDCQSGLQSRMLYCILSHIVGSLSGILMPLLLVIGTIGNAIVAHVMLKRLRPLTRQNLYLGCIAIADILGLLFIGLWNGLLPKGLPWLTGGKYAIILYNISDSLCKTSRYVLNFFHALTAMWLLVLVADRVLVVYNPLLMKQYGTRWAAGALIISLLLSALVALPNGALMGFLYLELPGNMFLTYCYRLPGPPRVLMVSYTVLMSNPPTLIIVVMLVLNLVLMRKVAVALKERKKLMAGASQASGAADLNGTIIVLILTIIYLFLHIPAAVMRSILEITLDQMNLATNADHVSVVINVAYSTLTIALINQCVNFFVLFSRSASFKRSTLEICCCCCCCCPSVLRNWLSRKASGSEYRADTRLELQNNRMRSAAHANGDVATGLEK